MILFVAINAGALAMNLLQIKSDRFVWMAPGPFRRTSCSDPARWPPHEAIPHARDVALPRRVADSARRRPVAVLSGPGTFWHVAVGDRIIADGFFDTDPYTFTFGGQKWIPHQWLGESAMAVVHKIAGFDGLLLATAAVLAALHRPGGSALANWLPSNGGGRPRRAAIASSGHFHVRPHLATIVGMAVVMVFLTDVENGRLPMAEILADPVVWLWSNIHGGVLGGLATIALAIAGWTAFRLVGRESPVKRLRFRAAGIDLARLRRRLLPESLFSSAALVVDEIYQMSSLPGIIKEYSRLDARLVRGSRSSLSVSCTWHSC